MTRFIENDIAAEIMQNSKPMLHETAIRVRNTVPQRLEGSFQSEVDAINALVEEALFVKNGAQALNESKISLNYVGQDKPEAVKQKPEKGEEVRHVGKQPKAMKGKPVQNKTVKKKYVGESKKSLAEAFMKPEVYEGDAYLVDGRDGITVVPAELAGDFGMKVGDVLTSEDSNFEEVKEALVDFTEGGEIHEISFEHGWLGRYQAPGYLDATEWDLYKSQEEAEKKLQDMYGDDEEMEDESEGESEEGEKEEPKEESISLQKVVERLNKKAQKLGESNNKEHKKLAFFINERLLPYAQTKTEDAGSDEKVMQDLASALRMLASKLTDETEKKDLNDMAFSMAKPELPAEKPEGEAEKPEPIGESKKKSKKSLKEDEDSEEDESSEDSEEDDSEESESQDEPQEEDIVMQPSGRLGSRTLVSVVGGKKIGEFIEIDDAEKAIREYMKKNNVYPTVWQISDHGNASVYSMDKQMSEEKEGTYKSQADGKMIRTKVFSSDKEANDFMMKNKGYGVVGVGPKPHSKEGEPGYEVHVAHERNMGKRMGESVTEAYEAEDFVSLRDDIKSDVLALEPKLKKLAELLGGPEKDDAISKALSSIRVIGNIVSSPDDMQQKHAALSQGVKSGEYEVKKSPQGRLGFYKKQKMGEAKEARKELPVIREIAELLLVDHIASELEEKGKFKEVHGELTQTVPEFVKQKYPAASWDALVGEVLPDLSELTAVSEKIIEGVKKFGKEEIAWELFNQLSGHGGSHGGEVADFIEQNFDFFDPDAGRDVAMKIVDAIYPESEKMDEAIDKDFKEGDRVRLIGHKKNGVIKFIRPDGVFEVMADDGILHNVRKGAFDKEELFKK